MTGWPWPLDAAQDWFEGLWNWVSESAMSASTWLYDQVKPLFDAVESWVSGAVSQLQSWLGPLFGPLLTWGSDIVAAFWTSLQAFTEDPVGFLGGAIGDLTATIQGLVEPISKAVIDGLAAAGAWLGDAAAWLSQTIFGWFDGLGRWLTDSFKWLQDVVSENSSWTVDQVRTMFDGAFAGIGGAFADALAGLQDMILGAFEALYTWLYTGLQNIWGAIQAGITWFTENVTAFFTGIVTDLASRVREAAKPGSPPPELLGEMTGLVQDWNTMISMRLEQVSKSPVKISDIVTVATGIAGASLGAAGLALAVGMAADASNAEKEWGARDAASLVLGYLGLEATISPLIKVPYERGVLEPLTQWFNTVYLASIPGVADATRMLWRTKIDQDQFLDVVRRQGFGAPFDDAYLDLTSNIPGAGDLITFVVREVITFPDFQANMLYQGFNAFWSQAYWAAHWVLPAFERVVDAYHRGILNGEELDTFLVWHDFSPDPRPGISISDVAIMRGLLKTPVGRVDLRRGWELGRISDEELVRRFEWLGYEDDAPLVAEVSKLEALDAERNRLIANAKADHVEGFIDEAELRSRLESLGVPDTVISFHIADAVEDRERTYKKRLVDLFQDTYVKDVPGWTDDFLREQLSQIIVVPEALDLAMSIAYVRRYLKPKAGAPP